MIKCTECDKQHADQKAHDRHLARCHDIRKIVICCIFSRRALTIEQFESRVQYSCTNCNILFWPQDNRQNFCSRSCGATFNNNGREYTEETIQKMSSSQKNFCKNIRTDDHKQTYVCRVCSVSFRTFSAAKYCSKECYRLTTVVKVENRKPQGGYRPRSGRGKHGWYDGIWCDSTYEMAYVWWCRQQNISIERAIITFGYTDSNGESRTYHPDFMVDGNLIEIKGWIRPNDLPKMENCADLVRIITGKEIKDIVKAAKKHFGVSNLSTLFAENRPSYGSTICSVCKKEFEKSNPKTKLCSRICSGKAAKLRNHGPADES